MGSTQQWYAHGKLLLTGEYLVMEGAKALALPLKPGQSLAIKTTGERHRLRWQAFHPEGRWFSAVFDTSGFEVIETDNRQLAGRLAEILIAVRSFSPDFLSGGTSVLAETKLEFDPDFGFGSSSTLITNLARWAGVDPYDLLRQTFGGSGYDLACAGADGPVFFRLEGESPQVERISFDPPFKDNIYFVYLGRKQRSTESIRRFRKTAVFRKEDLEEISRISERVAEAESLEAFESLLNEHEARLSAILDRPTVASLLFDGYEGTVKSLGGWGGDFVLLTTRQSETDLRAEMKEGGFRQVFRYGELVL